MGFPKLPTVGGYKVEIKPKMGTSDTHDGTARAKTKQDREVEANATRPDERNLDQKKLKQEHDAKILEEARKLDLSGQNAKDVKTIADQNSKILRRQLEQRLKQKSAGDIPEK